MGLHIGTSRTHAGTAITTAWMQACSRFVGNTAFPFLQSKAAAGARAQAGKGEGASLCYAEAAGIPGGERFPLKHMARRTSQRPWQQLSGFPA